MPLCESEGNRPTKATTRLSTDYRGTGVAGKSEESGSDVKFRFVRKAKLTPFLFLATVVGHVIADDQIVTISSGSVVAAASQTGLGFDLQYSTNPVDLKSSGLGVRLFYDSMQIQSIILSNALNNSLIGTQEGRQDTSDLDSDPSTDMYIIGSWASLSGNNWPSDPQPVSLFSISYATTASYTGTRFNVASSDTAVWLFFRWSQRQCMP